MEEIYGIHWFKIDNKLYRIKSERGKQHKVYRRNTLLGTFPTKDKAMSLLEVIRSSKQCQ